MLLVNILFHYPHPTHLLSWFVSSMKQYTTLYSHYIAVIVSEPRKAVNYA